MYKIKIIPEDFFVKEILDLSQFSEGKRYGYFILKKKNLNTMDAVERIAEYFKLPLKDIGFAGIKDKNAVTEQYISIKGIKKDIALKDIQLKYVKCGNEPISLGMNKSNLFEITIRNLGKDEIKIIDEYRNCKKLGFINYFGEQRFSRNNIEIGRYIIKKNFRKAVELILKTASKKTKKLIEEKMQKSPNDYLNALKTINRKLLSLYIHSFQSYLWNKLAEEFKAPEIYIPGFEEDKFSPEIKKRLMEYLKKEGIGFRDFIIRQIPNVFTNGTSRKRIIEVHVNFGKIEKDERFENKKKIKIGFELPKGSYATVFIGELFKKQLICQDKIQRV